MLATLLLLFFPNPRDLESRDYATRDAATRALSTPLALPLLYQFAPSTPEGVWRRDRAMTLPYNVRTAWRYLPLLAPGGRDEMKGPGRDAWLLRFDEDALYVGMYSAWDYVHHVPPVRRQYDYDNVYDVAIPNLLKRLGVSR